MLVRLVVGRGQHGDLLPLDGRQAELLRALHARHGPAGRLGLGPPDARGPGPPPGAAGWRPASSCRRNGCCSSSAAWWPRSWSGRGSPVALALDAGPGRRARGRGRRQRHRLAARGRRVALAPITAAWALGIVVVYGLLAPADNPLRSHRELAQALDRLVPPGVRSIHFFNELDEGLWFYLDGLDLLPVPGTQPRYSTAYDLAEAFHARRDSSDSLDTLDVRREALEKRALLSWLDRRDESSAFLLIRSSLFDRYAPRPGRPRDPAPPRDRAEPQGAGPAPRRRPSAPGRVRLARLEMILADLPARVAPQDTRMLPDMENVRVGETPPGRVAGLRRSRGHPSLCRSPGLPDRDDRQAFSP